MSFAFSNSRIPTSSLLKRAAIKAASLARLAKSAPEKPGVPLAISIDLTFLAIGSFLICTFKIASRPLISGNPTVTVLSNLPGLSKAGSRTSGRLVAATTIIPSEPSKPSISTSIWFSVCSRSSCPPPIPAPRWRPTASISSIKIIQGAFFLACSNISRTLEAPTPTNISTKSDPEIKKNGTSASPATALANKVFPVPGGPTIRTPFGIFPPTLVNLEGSERKSTSSPTSSFASSTPATSSNVTWDSSLVISLAFDFPNDIGFFPPIAPPAPFIVYKITPIKSSIGASEIINCFTKLSLAGGVACTETPLLRRSPIKPRSPGL